MKTVLNIIKYALLLISVLVVVLLVVRGENGVDLALTWTFILVGIALAVTLLMPLVNIAQNPKGALRSLIGLAIVVVVLGIAYAMAGTAPVPNSEGGFFTNVTDLKISDMGLYTTYIALGGAILVAILGEIRNSFK